MNNETDLSGWLGKEDLPCEDVITAGLAERYSATLGRHLAALDGELPGIHWCLSPAAIEQDELGQDGHPAKGGFLPPVPLPRRMWAGGELEFFAPLQFGDTVKRASRIEAIDWKNGRSGKLCFVTVGHEYTVGETLAVRELQNLVYREAASGPATASENRNHEGAFEHERQVEINSTTLFRYSALTFNGHRIHYDAPYAREVEFYPDLVIHGPLQATLMLNLAAGIRNEMPKQFSYRGLSPATGAQTLRLGANVEGDGCKLSVITKDGVQSMAASANW